MTAVLAATELIDRKLGEFVLREHIGEGGFGLVFRAEQPILEREAVVKVAQLAAGADPAAVQRFLKEARLASRLDHPFAAHVYAFGAEPDGLLWIAMELVRGTPLDRLLLEGPLPLERAIPFLRRLCEIVHTAHEQGIVHRDLKPGNIMVVVRAGNVFPKLLDLGIAKDVGVAEPGAAAAGGGLRTATSGSVTGPGSLGTPLYMAPEQWVDAALAGPPADVYALGVVTYEVLTGKPPFTGRTVMEIAAQHARKAPPALPDGFPPELSTAIARAMAKRAAERWPSALALGEALRETSGITLDVVNLPRIDELTRDEVMVHAPQPIAEVVAVLDGARSPQQARDAMWRVAETCAQYVGLVALACRARAGPGRHGEPPAVAQLLAELRASGLAPTGWWKLARELCRPFADIPDAHPMPELVGLFFEHRAELETALDALFAARAREPGRNAPAEEIRAYLVGAVPALATVLRSLRFCHDYPLVVPADGAHEVWMGVRRANRATVTPPRAVEHPSLLDAAGRPVVQVWPLVQAAPPAPGAPAELFWLDGPGRGGVGARLVSEPDRYQRSDEALWDSLGLAIGGAGGGEAADGASADDAAPYLGLMTFTEADASLFFGREREVEAFVNRLRTKPLIAVVGPSGAGKSSFVQAGVLPALAGTWRALVVRPGPAPIANLVARLETIEVRLDAATLRADPEALGVALRARSRANREGVLLVVDQFEELFTLCFDAEEQDAYASALTRIARGADEDVRVVVTLRDDFLVRAAELPALRERLATSLQILTTPVEADLLRILVEPARRAGFGFEDDALPKSMVDEVAGQPAALALLSFTAYQLWQFRDRQFRILPRKAYRALGGVGGALAQHAEATLDAMSEAERKIVREVFRHLVTADGTRAVLSRAELLQVSGGAAAAPVLERLITARLLVAQEAASGESIEVVHEALLSAWPRLVRWRQEDAESARLRDQLRVAARQWEQRGRPRGLLWRGEALTEYQLWRARYPGALTDVEDAFGKSSVVDAARGRRLRRLALGIVIAGLAIALVIFWRLRGVAEENQQRAVASEAVAQHQLIDSYIETGRRALVADDTAGALLFLNEAFQRGADTPALRFMLARALEPLEAEVATLQGHEAMVKSVAFSPDGQHIATAGEDGTARIWDRTGKELLVIRGLGVGQRGEVAWSPDGKLLATTGVEPALWDAKTGTLVKKFAGGEPVQKLELSADGRLLLAHPERGPETTIRVWDIASGSARVVEHFTNIEAIAATFSPDATRVAVVSLGNLGAAGPAFVHTLATGRRVMLEGHTEGVWFAFFDPAGARIVTTSIDRTARIWDAASGKSLHVLTGHDSRVTYALWTPDGKRVITSSADTTIRIWDSATGTAQLTLRGHTAQVNHLALSRDGTLLVSSAADGTARVWDTTRGALLATLSHGGFVFRIALARDDELLATTSWLGTGKLWKLSRDSLARMMPGAPPPEGIADPWPQLTADGERAVRVGAKAVEIWDLASGEARRLTAAPAPAPTPPALDRDGRTIAVATSARAVTVYEVATGTVTATMSTPLDVASIALAPKADRILVGGCLDPDRKPEAPCRRGGLELRAIRDGAIVAKRDLAAVPAQLMWFGNPDRVLAVVVAPNAPPRAALVGADLAEIADLGDSFEPPAIAPDDQQIAITAGNMVTIFDRDGRRVKPLEHRSDVSFVAWTPTADRLLVSLVDGGVQVWRRSDWKDVARIPAHDMFIPWLSVSADGHFAVTAGFDQTVKIWDLATYKQLYQIRAAPQTGFAALDATGRRLVTASPVDIDARPAGLTAIDPPALAARLACKLPFELREGTMVPRALVPCAR